MDLTFKKLSRHLDHFQLHWVIGMFGLFVFLFAGFAMIKFFRFQYDLLDLAIFDQVIKQTLQGNWFHFTIHPGSYLGDHLGLFLIALVPFYAIVPHPLTLITLQIIAIGLCVFPLARLSRTHLPSWLTLVLVFWFLFNPIIQHIALFEFHLLPFALIFIFWGLVFFQEKKFGRFVIMLIASLLVREDVGLFWMFFSVYATLSRRSIKWIVLPFIIPGIWFFTALQIISFANPDQSYKFLVYYQALGHSPINILQNLFVQPQVWIGQLFRIQNLAYVLMIIILTLGLPLFSLLALLPLIPTLAQLFLASFGGSEVTLFSHYSTLILPPLFLASIFSLSRFISSRQTTSFKTLAKRLRRFHQEYFPLLEIIAATIMIYSIITLAPLPQMIVQTFQAPTPQNTNLRSHILNQIPKLFYLL